MIDDRWVIDDGWMIEVDDHLSSSESNLQGLGGRQARGNNAADTCMHASDRQSTCMQHAPPFPDRQAGTCYNTSHANMPTHVNTHTHTHTQTSCMPALAVFFHQSLGGI